MVVRPRWLGLLAVAVAIAGVMGALGVWQLDVYRSKTAAATAERAAQPPVPLDSLMSLDEGLSDKAVGRQVTVSGRWAPAADQVFVSDRLDGGRTGLWVVTPLLVSPSSAVLVVRGWTPSAAATAPSGSASVTGTVVASEGEDASAAAARGRVLPSLRIPTIVGMVDYRLYDAFVVLSSSTPPAATAVPASAPPPPTDHAGLRNIAYAVQWWIFAAFALFMWGRLLVDARRAAVAPADGSGPAGTVSA